MNRKDILFNGIIRENPVLVLLLGACPSLAVTTSAANGLGMGISSMLVLIGANVVVSLLKNVIPEKVRIPCYIVVIAGFVTIIGFLVKAYAPAIDQSLGIFLPLIVVNCIILGRAEMFASKNSVFNSVLDAVGMGLGFTLALFAIGSIREILGGGAIFSIKFLPEFIPPMGIFLLAPGGFFVYGCLIALVNRMGKGKMEPKEEMGCAGCPSAGMCGKNKEEGCSE